MWALIPLLKAKGWRWVPNAFSWTFKKSVFSLMKTLLPLCGPWRTINFIFFFFFLRTTYKNLTFLFLLRSMWRLSLRIFYARDNLVECVFLWKVSVTPLSNYPFSNKKKKKTTHSGEGGNNFQGGQRFYSDMTKFWVRNLSK